MELIRLRSLSRSQDNRKEEREEDSTLIGKASLSIGVAETEGEGTSSTVKALVLSAIAGNTLEWYDFGVFASFSSEISQAFFTGGRLEETLKVYGVFAVAFLARPVGGLLFGLIGDRYGRTISLQVSVILMGLSVLLMAVIPTNSLGRYSIGSAATMLVVVVRLIQGLSVGGEMVGSYLYMVENVPGKWKCVVSTAPSASASLGVATG
jgi:MHS family proline/betaine transporter-like MFS transporter